MGQGGLGAREQGGKGAGGKGRQSDLYLFMFQYIEHKSRGLLDLVENRWFEVA